jgi:hypothetical protein
MDENQTEQPLPDSEILNALRDAQPAHRDEYKLRGKQESKSSIVGDGVSGQGDHWSIQQ